jgi:LysR family transcriptional regulator, glycine cleavage system transcriptional activator
MKALNRVHLNGLRAAEAAGRLGSLPAAAEELGVTVSAVSQHILKLERQLGRALFERTGRGVVTTPSAAAILAQLTRGMTELNHAVGQGFRQGANTLVLSAAPVFAAKWLVSRLIRFSRLHPTVRLRLEASATHVDLDGDDVDLAIRVGRGEWPSVEAQFLLSQDLFPVAAPAVAAKIKTPEDLCRAAIIRDANSTLPWSLWLDHFGMNEKVLPAGSSFSDAGLCLDAAIAGQGVMLAWNILAQDALADGRLVAPFAHRAATGLGYWLVSSKLRRPTVAMRRFSDWIVSEMTALAPGERPPRDGGAPRR